MTPVSKRFGLCGNSSMDFKIRTKEMYFKTTHFSNCVKNYTYFGEISLASVKNTLKNKFENFLANSTKIDGRNLKI